MTFLPNLETCRDPNERTESGAMTHICRLLETAAAAAFGVPVDALRAPTRGKADAALARQSAMYLAHVTLGLNYSAIGALFHRDRTTAAHACQRIEDRRDDPALDDLLQTLEQICEQFARRIRPHAQVQP
jgi:chromosomal replication initiation ATPase DnaA